MKAKVPNHLKADTQKWVKSILNDYELEPHHVKLLILAAESWDRLTEARERIAEDGPYTENRFGELKPHPALAVERDNKVAFARLLRELALDVNEPGESRPPVITGNAILKRGV